MSEMSQVELVRALTELPALKASAAREAEDAVERWKMSRQEAKLTKARALLRLKALGHYTKQAELTAAAEIETDAVQAEQAAIRAESAMRRMEIEVERLDDAFTGAKMIGRLRMAEMGGGLFHEGARRRLPE